MPSSSRIRSFVVGRETTVAARRAVVIRAVVDAEVRRTWWPWGPGLDAAGRSPVPGLWGAAPSWMAFDEADAGLVVSCDGGVLEAWFDVHPQGGRARVVWTVRGRRSFRAWAMRGFGGSGAFEASLGAGLARLRARAETDAGAHPHGRRAAAVLPSPLALPQVP